jgi:uncharacterized protein (DUF1330 family)
MSDTNIDPDRETWDRFKSLPRDQPIQMLNMIKLKPLAEYPPDHPDHGKGLTGRQVYEAYGREGSHIFQRLGGRQVWSASPEMTVIGPKGEAWDLIFVVEYPSADAFLSMIFDPEYREHIKLRTAAAADSRLIRLNSQG